MAGSQSAFAAGVLRGIGAPVTSQNVAGIIGWAKAEDGWSHNNPLNTTQNAPGASNFNSVGVKTYPTLQAGVQATVQTLKNGRYGNIIQTLRSGNVHGLAGAIGSSPWGTSGSLAAQTIAQTLGQPVSIAPNTGAGMSPTPKSAGSQSLSQTVPTFNQAAYQKANDRYIAGSFLQGEKNPFDIGPKGGDTGPNPLFSQGALTTSAPNVADYQGTKTLHVATGELQKVAGTSLVNVHPGAKGYVNPIPGAVIGRTDMGVDANLKVGAPIRAIGDSRVVGISPNWYKSQPYVLLQLLSGPQKGKFYYVAEQIAPTVKAGQTLRAGQPIGTYAQSGTGIEIGWGSPSPGRTLAQATSGYSEGQVTPAGASFRSFLGSLD